MRYKEFNRNKVLEDCIQLFWEKGFNSCSISDIVERTKVNRYSLYEEFEDKDGILLQTLILYKKRYTYTFLFIFGFIYVSFIYVIFFLKVSNLPNADSIIIAPRI